MSENIESSLNRLGKKHGNFGYPKSTGPGDFGRQDSTITKFSNIAISRERIELPDDNKHIQSFKKVYDKHFREFKEKLI